LIAVVNLIKIMTAWPTTHTLLSNDQRAACQDYDAFLIWLLKGISLGEESARDLANDPQNVRWDAAQDAIRAFLGVEYEEVAKLLAAGAKRIERLNKWLDSTAVEPVNLPSVSITLQPLKPSCSCKFKRGLLPGDTVPAASFAVRFIAFARWC
jgi:hypothetical protein